MKKFFFTLKLDPPPPPLLLLFELELTFFGAGSPVFDPPPLLEEGIPPDRISLDDIALPPLELELPPVFDEEPPEEEEEEEEEAALAAVLARRAVRSIEYCWRWRRWYPM